MRLDHVGWFQLALDNLYMMLAILDHFIYDLYMIFISFLRGNQVMDSMIFGNDSPNGWIAFFIQVTPWRAVLHLVTIAMAAMTHRKFDDFSS